MLRLAVAACFFLAVYNAAQSSERSSPSALPEAMQFFAHEKSAAEQNAVILATVEKGNTSQYLRGLQLYADAKAEFDGLIEELRADLLTQQEPTKTAKFAEMMTRAADKRVAFTSFVSDEVDHFHGARPGLPSVIRAVPDLIKAITDAGLSIWNAYRDAARERRDVILNELERQRWQAVGELVKP